MRTKFLVVGTVAAGTALFVWGALSRVILPWPKAALRAFPNDSAAAAAVRAVAPENGVYFSPRGVFVAVSLRPDLANKVESVAPNLVAQYVDFLAVAFALALLLSLTPLRSVRGAVLLCATAAVGAALDTFAPYRNWYGFSTAFTLAEFVDLVVGWSVAGAVLGVLRKRLDLEPAPGDAGPRT